MTYHPRVLTRQRFHLWLRSLRPLTWLDTLTCDYRDWRPDPPVWERLIR